MSRFRVTVGYFVSQCIEVDASTYEDAVDEAFDQVDTPNVSNQFEQDGDPELVAVYGEDGNALYERET